MAIVIKSSHPRRDPHTLYFDQLPNGTYFYGKYDSDGSEPTLMLKVTGKLAVFIEPLARPGYTHCTHSSDPENVIVVRVLRTGETVTLEI